MSEVNEEKVAEMRAKLEASNEQRRELLRKVVEVAEHALAHQPENVRECWCHFNAAQLALRQMMRPKPNTLAFVNEKWWYKENDAGTGLGAVDPAAGSGAFITPKDVIADPALKAAVEPQGKPLCPDAPEMARGEKKKAIGNFAGAGKVVSYAIDEMYAVTVTANTTGNGAWMFKGIKNGETEIIGTIIGGKWKAMQYCKFIRNGIVSRANRLYHAHHKTKAASALAGAPSDAADAN